jgi:acyl-CoA synthetase (AMP-forming)/AMP-acid ligase II
LAELLNASQYLLDRRLEAGDGDRVAFQQGQEQVTYAELAGRVGQVANALRSIGVRPEERVPLVMLDGVDWVASFLAALRIGAVPVPMSTMLTGAELAFQCNDARARVAIASGALGPSVKEMVAACDELEDLVVAGNGESEVGVGGVHVHRFEEWAGGQPAEAPQYAT